MEPRPWKLRAPEDQAEQDALASKVQNLQAETGLSRLTLQICLSRGLESAEAIQHFLSPRLEELKDPFTIQDMSKAIERLSLARAQKERLRVFGDYDVDGTTGAALFTWIFREFGFEFDVRQPDRFKDGYGLNVAAVEDAKAAGVQILVTVDCGITSFDAIRRAGELGIEVIVVDHHQIDSTKGVPPAYAVLDPQRADCPSGLKQLCGCGLAFYVARALRSHGRQQGWWAPGAEPNLKQHLDLVVLATAADMVPLTGDNHTLVRHGLQILKHSKKPGVRALLESAGLAGSAVSGTRDLTPSHLGFVLGPRINASGRLGSASTAWELLTTDDPLRAAELAQTLDQMNRERAQIQNQIWDEVRRKVETGLAAGKFRHGIVVGDPGWHEGVIGIVASRVVEAFRKPAAVLSLREDYGKGSVRTYAGKNVLEALKRSSRFLRTFGGHQHAAGLSVELDQFDAFAEAFDQALSEIEVDAGALPLLIEGPCEVEELDVKALQEIEALGPFGPGNPEPVFTMRASVKSKRVLKERHLKLNLAPAGSGRARTIEAIWFHAAEMMEESGESLETADSEWAGVPELNRFRGRVTPTFRVRDWRKI